MCLNRDGWTSGLRKREGVGSRCSLLRVNIERNDTSVFKWGTVRGESKGVVVSGCCVIGSYHYVVLLCDATLNTEEEGGG